MEKERVLTPTTYDLEIWDWHTNSYVADISGIIDNLSIDWKLDDAEELSFELDLIQFEIRCKAMGATPSEVLAPYVHDIRVKRNGEYILGCQVVETDIKIENESPPKIEVKCSGFLNLFKDCYLTYPWSGYTYSEIARRLVDFAQKGDCLVKNPTIDIDTAYWLTPVGTIAKDNTLSHSGTACLRVSGGGNIDWIGAGTRLFCPAGTQVTMDVWVRGHSGNTISFRERELINKSTNQSTILEQALTTSDTWQRFTATFTTQFDKGYFLIEQQARDDYVIDDVHLFRSDDTAALNDMKVALGVNTTTGQSTRELKYDLQNVKDALIDLTTLEDDNFDFAFRPDRTFDCFAKKGEVKDIEAVYPGNIHSLEITRSAADLANKIYNIGSGIGDERIESYASDTTSRQTYGTRESVITNSNITLQDTLDAQAQGELLLRKDPTDEPYITIRDGSINPSNVQVGDSIYVLVEGDEYLSTINGLYRIMEMKLSIDSENMEDVSLTLEREESLSA